MSTSSKRLGLFSITLLGINSMIGTGIFILPGKMMSLVGTLSPFLFLLATLLITSIALCFAKCATLFNRNGAAYLYAKEAFGDFVGFEVGMMKWVVSIIAWAALAAGFITVLSPIFPSVMEEPVRSLLIIALISSLTLLNIFGINSFKFLNNILTIAKIIPLLAVAVLGLFFVKHEYLTSPFLYQMEEGSFKEALLIVFYAFTGFETLAIAAQEMENPQRNIPIAIVTVIGFCSFLYFLLQIVAIGILGPQLADSLAPISDIAQEIIGKPGRDFVNIGMLVSLGGINLAASFMSPRSIVALAEDRLIPESIASKNRFNTPYIAIFLTAFLACSVALSGNFFQLAVLSVIARFAQYIPTCLALLILRKRAKWSNQLQGKAFVYIPVIALAFSFWLLWQVSWVQLFSGLGALIVGIPLYFICERLKDDLEPESHASIKSTLN